MVPPGAYRRGHRLPWPYDHLWHHTLDPTYSEHSHSHQRYLCIPRSCVQVSLAHSLQISNFWLFSMNTIVIFSIFSGLTAIATYLLTSELWSRGAGLFAACFIAIIPGYSSRSVAGSYDT